GSYLDQRENHAAIAPYVSGKQVLDACCCTGGFGLHAAGYGAEFVTASDISADVLEQAKENYARNGFDRVEFIEADVFELLREYERQGRQFDVVILDPPAFCKNKSALEKACRGYKEINLRALRLLPKGGILVSNSCSHYLTPELFWEVLRSAAEDAGKGLRVIEQRIQSRDHPVTLGDPQSLYLKCMILQVI
ncbi:MAG: class I SAM-dependent rRNA methyltransferase, partial [Clostridia bacterium]|nr:class I SAM-dependent rRNA methyltransferase [Clostridia bacterium]